MRSDLYLDAIGHDATRIVMGAFVGPDRTSVIPASPSGLGAGSIVLTAILTVLLAYLYTLDFSTQKRTETRTTLLILILPLLIAFGVIVLFSLLAGV
jgi:hypothetical protein